MKNKELEKKVRETRTTAGGIRKILLQMLRLEKTN
jgi:hypothetical protein